MSHCIRGQAANTRMWLTWLMQASWVGNMYFYFFFVSADSLCLHACCDKYFLSRKFLVSREFLLCLKGMYRCLVKVQDWVSSWVYFVISFLLSRKTNGKKFGPFFVHSSSKISSFIPECGKLWYKMLFNDLISNRFVYFSK